MKKEREWSQLNEKEMWLLREILSNKNNVFSKCKCCYCGKDIKEGDKFSIINKPNRLCCNSVVCLSSMMSEVGE
jgi:hypothetical protein